MQGKSPIVTVQMMKQALKYQTDVTEAQGPNSDDIGHNILCSLTLVFSNLTKDESLTRLRKLYQALSVFEEKQIGTMQLKYNLAHRPTDTLDIEMGKTVQTKLDTWCELQGSINEIRKPSEKEVNAVKNDTEIQKKLGELKEGS